MFAHDFFQYLGAKAANEFVHSTHSMRTDLIKTYGFAQIISLMVINV